jgi:hypothetical protein
MLTCLNLKTTFLKIDVVNLVYQNQNLKTTFLKIKIDFKICCHVFKKLRSSKSKLYVNVDINQIEI